MDEKNIFTDEVVENLRKIAHYIFDEFKDSCIHANYGPDSPMNRNIDETGGEELLNDAADFFSYEIIGLCGCGLPEYTIKKITDYLEIADLWTKEIHDSKDLWHDNGPITRRMDRMKKQFGVTDVCEDPILQFMAYALDTDYLTEHGSNITGCWITDRGRACLYVYKLYLQNEGFEDDTEDKSKITVKSFISKISSVTVYLYSSKTGQLLGGGFTDNDVNKADFDKYADCIVDKISVQNYRINLIIDDTEVIH